MNPPSPNMYRRTFLLAAGSGVGIALASVTSQQPAGRASTPEATPATEASPSPDAGETRVRFSVDDVEIVVCIAENHTSRDFLSMLPLTLEFQEFAGNEKISYLPRALTTEGSTGHAPANGDLIYYVPWGNLGFFYNADPGATADDSVILIGTIETGFELLPRLETGPVQVDVVP